MAFLVFLVLVFSVFSVLVFLVFLVFFVLSMRYTSIFCTLGTEIVSLIRREICKKILEKTVDKHAAVVYNTLENKEGRCIRLTSRISKEVNSVI